MTTRRSSLVKFLVLGALLVAASGAVALSASPREALASNRPGCPKHLKHRSAEETIRQHLALLQAGDVEQAMCDYADDAVVVLPGQTISGLDYIRSGLTGVVGLLGGAVPQIQTLTATNSLVMITFTALGSPCSIPDGSDTYVVHDGQITAQTVHDTFHSAPGQTCPVAAPGN
jgi:hypothetical protein